MRAEGGNNLLFAHGTTERMRIDASGNVGIGTTSPSTKLKVSSGHINIDSGYSYQWGDSHERIEQSDGQLEFFTGNGTKMTLKGDNLGIGTDDPADILHLQSTAPILKVDATNNSSGLRVDILGQSGGANNQLFRVQKDSTTMFQINDDGDVIITGNDNSELKLKAGNQTGNGIIAFLNSSGSTKGNIFY